MRRLPVIGTIATMPTRTHTFARVIEAVLPQVDRLYVFLDGFTETPAGLRDHAKCDVTHLDRERNLHASSRFLAPHLFGKDATVVFIDDDILYPRDYVARISAALDHYRHPSIVGFHGNIFLPPHRSYAKHRHNLHFSRALKQDTIVHELGCGTMAFRSDTFRPDPRTWAHHSMDDLYLSSEAISHNQALIALKRSAGWLVPLAENQADSIWLSTLRDDRLQSQFMRYVLAESAKSTRTDWWLERMDMEIGADSGTRGTLVS